MNPLAELAKKSPSAPLLLFGKCNSNTKTHTAKPKKRVRFTQAPAEEIICDPNDAWHEDLLWFSTQEIASFHDEKDHAIAKLRKRISQHQAAREWYCSLAQGYENAHFAAATSSLPKNSKRQPKRNVTNKVVDACNAFWLPALGLERNLLFPHRRDELLRKQLYLNIAACQTKKQHFWHKKDQQTQDICKASQRISLRDALWSQHLAKIAMSNRPEECKCNNDDKDESLSFKEKGPTISRKRPSPLDALLAKMKKEALSEDAATNVQNNPGDQTSPLRRDALQAMDRSLNNQAFLASLPEHSPPPPLHKKAAIYRLPPPRPVRRTISPVIVPYRRTYGLPQEQHQQLPQQGNNQRNESFADFDLM